MESLKQSGAFSVPEAVLSKIRADFMAHRASEDEVAAAIKTVLRESQYLMDPHTATGFVAAEKAGLSPDVPVVLLATAAPAKFPEAMLAITGIHPALPPRLSRLMQDEERMEAVACDGAALEAFIRARVQA